MEDSYYAYKVGLVMQNRLLPADQVHTNYLVDYVANQSTENVLKSYDQVSYIRPYYLIGLGDNSWNNSVLGIGSSLYPMSLVMGNVYNASGDGTFMYTGYFQASRPFKLIRDIGSMQEQWGENSGVYVHNDPASGNITVPSDGYYTIILNSIANTLIIISSDVQPTAYNSLGLIGDINSWLSDITMVPAESVNNHVWYVHYTFNANSEANGGVKFRANGIWDVNWGCAQAYFGVGLLDGANIPYAAGTYTILLNDLDGTYYFFNPSGNITASASQKAIKFACYPNPVTDVIHISGVTGTAQVKLLDMNGKELYKGILNDGTISVSSLHAGMYILQVATQQGLFTSKFVKK